MGGSFNKYDWRNLAKACENYKSQQFESICNLFNLVPIKSHRFSLSLDMLCFAHILGILRDKGSKVQNLYARG